MFFKAHNKIKFVNGEIFIRLGKLHQVYLGNNTCIKEDFLDPSRILIMRQLVTKQCGFCEAHSSVEKATCKMTDQMNEIVKVVKSNENLLKSLKDFNDQSVELRKLREENVGLQTEIQLLKAKVADDREKINRLQDEANNQW